MEPTVEESNRLERNRLAAARQYLRREEQIVRIHPDLLELFQEWQEVEGVKLVLLDNGTYEVAMTKDVTLARYVDQKNRELLDS